MITLQEDITVKFIDDQVCFGTLQLPDVFSPNKPMVLLTFSHETIGKDFKILVSNPHIKLLVDIPGLREIPKGNTYPVILEVSASYLEFNNHLTAHLVKNFPFLNESLTFKCQPRIDLKKVLSLEV